MTNKMKYILAAGALVTLTACATAYVAKPLPFKMPEAYQNAQEMGGATIGARAYTNAAEARENFGFDIIAAGMLPVEVVIDNRGPHPLEINPAQSFLEDKSNNLWPILSSSIAYERATKYAQTKETFTQAGQSGFFGAVAGAAIGAAIGILSGRNVGEAAGRGAVAGGVGAGVLGGMQAYNEGEARHMVMDDLRDKSLKAKSIEPNMLSYGFIFFPGEAKTAKQLRLQVIEKDTGKSQVLLFNLLQ